MTDTLEAAAIKWHDRTIRVGDTIYWCGGRWFQPVTPGYGDARKNWTGLAIVTAVEGGKVTLFRYLSRTWMQTPIIEHYESASVPARYGEFCE